MQHSKTIITSFSSRKDFLNLLEENPGLIVLKFGATWCKPCKIIKPVVDAFFASSPNNVLCCDIDIDESFDLYAFLKSKKMVLGVPVLLCYTKGNTTYIPTDSVTGIDPNELDSFFRRCGKYIK